MMGYIKYILIYIFKTDTYNFIVDIIFMELIFRLGISPYEKTLAPSMNLSKNEVSRRK